MTQLSRARYAALFGPTTGDRIRLADTDLFIEITDDRSGGPGLAGDEAVFGGGKVLRESMGQGRVTRADGAPDTVITGAVILDHWGIIKADIGIRDGRIIAIGKAGNPDIMSGVHPDLVVGPSTEIIAGNGRIVTAGAIDCHVHLICPQIMEEALGGGITTIIAGGTGPAEGSKATTVTPGSWHLARMLEALDGWPLNIALLGKGNTVSAESMWEQLRGGAAGFKLHEDWGTTPAAIDACLTVSESAGVQVNIHTDTLNEAGFVEDTLAAVKGRSIHAYHTEGAGGGHAPDIITVVSHSNVLPSSTNPISLRVSECRATCTSASSATRRQASMAAGVVPQSSCSLKPAAPPRNCSHIESGLMVLPLPSNRMFIGQPSSACSMRPRCQAPGVTVVALLPSAGPVPPPIMVVMPPPMASSRICGQMKCT